MTWLSLEIEVVARTVEINGQQVNSVEPVLLAIALSITSSPSSLCRRARSSPPDSRPTAPLRNGTGVCFG